MAWNTAVFDSTGRLKYGTPSGPVGPIWDDYTDLPGNIENYGAQLDGVADDTDAIQAAIDSDNAVFIPPGNIKVSSTITITKPKSITCFGESFRSSEGIDDNRQNPHVLGAQPRFYPTGNFHLFEVRNLLNWRGGCFDFVNLSSPVDKAVFHIPMDWLGGEHGGVIRNVSAFGNQANHIQANDTDGAYIVYVDFENETTTGALFENWYIQVESRYIKSNFSVTDYNPGYSQNSEGHYVRSDMTGSYHAIQDEVSDESFFTGVMQAKRGTYNSDVTNLANSAMKIQGTRNVIQDPGLQDFWKDFPSGTGRHAIAIDIADDNFISELKGNRVGTDEPGKGGLYNVIGTIRSRNGSSMMPYDDFSNSDLNSSSSEPNTRDKYAGTQAYISDNPRFALGSNATDDWKDSDGDVTNNP